jgi:hypothetical protein
MCKALMATPAPLRDSPGATSIQVYQGANSIKAYQSNALALDGLPGFLPEDLRPLS